MPKPQIDGIAASVHGRIDIDEKDSRLALDRSAPALPHQMTNELLQHIFTLDGSSISGWGLSLAKVNEWTRQLVIGRTPQVEVIDPATGQKTMRKFADVPEFENYVLSLLPPEKVARFHSRKRRG